MEAAIANRAKDTLQRNENLMRMLGAYFSISDSFLSFGAT